MDHLVVSTMIESARPEHLVSQEFEGNLLHSTARAFTALHTSLKEYKWADHVEMKYLTRVNGMTWGNPKLITKGHRTSFPFLISSDINHVVRVLVETMVLSPVDLGEPTLLLGPTDIYDLWLVQQNDEQKVYMDDHHAAQSNFHKVKIEDGDVYASEPMTNLARWCVDDLIRLKARKRGVVAACSSKPNTTPPVSPDSWKAIRLADQELKKRSNYALPGLILEMDKLKEHYPGYLKGVTVINSCFFHVEAVEVKGDPLEAVHENNREFFLNVCGLGFDKFSTIEHNERRYVIVITPFGD